MATVLTDAGFTTSEPVLKGKCGNCDLCVKACPYDAIHNVNWERGLSRDTLIDAYLCNEKRILNAAPDGHKHNCGLCIQACRIGKK